MVLCPHSHVVKDDHEGVDDFPMDSGKNSELALLLLVGRVGNNQLVWRVETNNDFITTQISLHKNNKVTLYTS